MDAENGHFTGRQLRVIAACFLAYFCAYIGRLNMSATLGHVIEAMRVDEALGGTLQTVFAIVYAGGQFVFGAMVDRVRPRILLSVGLIGSAICNLAFSFSGAFGLMIAVWALNGLFQSMLWTPIVRTLAESFEGKKRMKASFVMSFTLACGHIAAWGLASLLSMYVGWRNAYRIPAAILFLACVGTNLILPGDAGNAVRAARTDSEANADGKLPIGGMLKTGLAFLFVGCIANGFIRDGVITWAPTIIGSKESLFSLIIPVINMVGILGGATAVRRFKGGTRVLFGCMMAACLLPALILMVCGSSVLLTATFLGVMSAILYGSNTLITTIIPMEYTDCGRVGLVAGLVDALIYVGSALAGTMTGWLHETTGAWTSVYLIWACVAVVGAVCSILSARGARRLLKQDGVCE